MPSVARLLLAAPCALAAALTVGCPGCGAPVLAPQALDGGAARVGMVPSCEPRERAGYGKQLVVDWPDDQRHQLVADVRADRGLSVVHFDGCRAELVPGCFASGKYHFNPSYQRERRRYADAVEVAASLPSAPGLAAVARDAGGGVVLDLVVAGAMESDPYTPYGALAGDCARATHVVASVNIGAFAVESPHPAAIADAGAPFDACVSDGGFASPVCSEPISVILIPVRAADSTAPPPATVCPDGQVASGPGCVPDVPALASVEADAPEARDVVRQLETATGTARGDLLLRLAQLHQRDDAAVTVILKPFRDPDLRKHPALEAALLLYRQAALNLGREPDVFAASLIIVQLFDDAQTAPAYLDVARHYCAGGDSVSADAFFDKIVKLFASEKSAANVVNEARRTRGTCARPQSLKSAPGSLPRVR